MMTIWEENDTVRLQAGFKRLLMVDRTKRRIDNGIFTIISFDDSWFFLSLNF